MSGRWQCVNVPVDSDGNPIPLKWGKVFKGGSMEAGVTTGRSLYSSYLDTFNGDPDDYNLPAVPGAWEGDYAEKADHFSLSHGIVKDGALECVDCHSAKDPVLDWEALGLTNPSPM